VAKKKSAVSKKISKIMKEGVRRNTKKPVSKKNPRRKVSQKQAIAIAMSMAGKSKKKSKKSKKH
jgi:hypothetical protein